MNIAFIPVRGGSKSIPLKNIKPIKEDIDFNDNVRFSVEHFV